MGNHHKRLLQTYRYNMNDTNARANIKHLPELTQEQIKKSNPLMTTGEVGGRSTSHTPDQRRVYSFGSGINSANGISTSFNFRANVPTSNMFNLLGSSSHASKHKSTLPGHEKEKAARTSRSSTESITDITGDEQLNGKNKPKGKKKNLESEDLSFLRSDDSSEDEFEDEIQNLQETSQQEQEGKPTVSQSDFPEESLNESNECKNIPDVSHVSDNTSNTLINVETEREVAIKSDKVADNESQNVTITVCDCCGQTIHTKCAREKCCRWKSCGKIKVNTY